MIDLKMNVKRMAEEKEIINETSEQILRRIGDTKNLFYQLDKHLDNFLKASCDYDSARQRVNPYIVKRVVSHISNGLNVSDAILLTADELGELSNRVEVLFHNQKIYMSALNLFAKKYMAERLKKSGYTTKKTAELIGVSENHVYKLLKCPNKFWELSH